MSKPATSGAKKPHRIVSWNLNGIRAVHNRGQFIPLFGSQPDIVCVQETKAEVSQLVPDVIAPSGYLSAFSSSKTRKGYSGVATFSRTGFATPIDVEGMGEKEFDQEGRVIHTEYPDFHLLNVYFPNGGGGPIRLDYKLRFYDYFLTHIKKLSKKKPVVFCGDINTAHMEIDLARPKENEKNTGFLPEERAWIDELVAAGYVDVFRHLYPRSVGAYTYWDMKTAARERNVGWRIDYFFCDHAFLPRVKDCIIRDDLYGSDHCPVELWFV